MGVGRESLHALVTWGSMRNHVEKKASPYAAVSTEVDSGHVRRNTVVGVESAAMEVAHLGSVQEDVTDTTRPLGRTLSTRSLGLRADVPHNVDTARSSVASLSNMPPSAASTVTLFEEFEAELLESPQAESTPHQSASSKFVMPPRRPPPPMPNRRSSGIQYIKSAEPEHPVTPHADATEHEAQASAIATIANLSSRALRLIPKASKLHRGSTEASSPKEGLRTLTLLQDRGNTVASSGNSPPAPAEIRPLVIGRAQKLRRGHHDENASVPHISSTSSRNKNLKSLTLVRSETSKMRGILRQTEVLPEVTVRPPSEHNTFGYNFRD